MNKLHLDTLAKNWTYLIDNLQVQGLMDYLIQDLVISVDVMEAVQAEKGRRQQARTFLTSLTRCGPGAFDSLLSALRNTQSFIAEKLQATLDEIRSPASGAVKNTKNAVYKCEMFSSM